jgi:LmbE family N-acetylglucosaminyl deacetylase
MTQSVMVIAPHPDDETLGCGGTLLRHIAEGDRVYWLIATQMSHLDGYSSVQMEKRQREIQQVRQDYAFAGVFELPFRAAQLDALPLSQLVKSISDVFMQVKPDTLYIPYRNDAHSDHGCVFDAVSACSKSFRYPFIKTVYAYETLSETGFALSVDAHSFNPNSYVCIDDYLERKLTMMQHYVAEVGEFPFPRSMQAIRALAQLRGTQASCHAAEAFMLLKSIR